MSYRFKEPGHGPSPGPDGMRSMGPGDPKFDDRMMGGMDGEKPPRGEMDDPSRGGSRLPPFRGRRPSPGRDKPFDSRSREYYGRDDMPPGRDRSPIRGGYDDRYPDRFKRDEPPFPRRDDRDGRKDIPRGFIDDPPYRDKYMAGLEGRGRFEPPGGFSSRYDLPDDPYRPRPFGYPGVPAKGFMRGEMMKANECEIIVVNKQQRAYAESVEARLKNLGILVDLLFLKDEALLVQTIDDIARRGSLYAIVISPLNETHGSVTLNILYGTPQEHRNMPLDDALKLVARNFHDYVRRQRELMERDRMERGMYSGPFPADREIQFLLRLLADGRQVSIGELETVIKYLTERRDRMKGAHGDLDLGPGPVGPGPAGPPPVGPDVGPSLPAPKDDLDMAKKEQDLQNRIMNIMNQGPPPAVESVGAQGGQAKPPMSMGMPNIPGMGADVQARSNQPPMSSNMGMGGGGGGPPSRMPGGQNQPGLGPMRGPGMGPGQMGGGGGNLPGLGPSQPGAGHNQGGLGPSQGGLGPVHGGIGDSQINTSSGPNQPPASSPSAYINFDNPSVKKALDNLMQSGSSLLKNISLSTASVSAAQDTNTSTSKMPPTSAGGGMGQQRGPGGMGDMGNVGMQSQGGSMGHMQGVGGGMGQMQNRNIGGPQQSGNMGPPQGMGPRQNLNAGPGSGPGMGPRSSSFQGPQGMYGGPGSNMMGNRPPYMGGGGSGGGGPMGGQGMGGSSGGGGPRRY